MNTHPPRGRLSLAFALLLAIAGAVLGFVAPVTRGAGPPTESADVAKPKTARGTRGLLLHDEEKACKGYTLLAPGNSPYTYLLDMQGRIVNSWKSDCEQVLSAYLLEDGHLLRTGQMKNPPYFGMGTTGRIQEFTWDGQIVWDYTYSNGKRLPHHDICKLPNGNVLMVAWDKKSAEEAVAAGRRPETVKDTYLLSGSILEVRPTGKMTGKIVWEWHAWDHLVQEFDKTKNNHGEVGAHPELIDVNFGESTFASIVAKPEEVEKLRAIGYVGGGSKDITQVLTKPDWLHMNAVAYNADLDQIIMSVHEFNEFWVIDHGTTTKEAAGHTKGKYGKGGDLLYRWGNPRTYRAGSVKDQKLFGQHNAHWIPKGLRGAGNILVFNNGLRRIGGAHSSIDEIKPAGEKGVYQLEKGKAFGPDKPAWSYAAKKKVEFYSAYISGTQRLSNGNTLICSGMNGTVFEVTPRGETVWKYANPEKRGLLGTNPLAMSGALFRAPRYEPDFPGLAKRALKPGKTVEEFQKDLAKEAPKDKAKGSKEK